MADRSGLSTAGGVIAAVGVVLVALSPTLLLGESLSAFGLGLTGAILLGVGMLARRRDASGTRVFGAILAVAGVLALALAIGLMAVLTAG